MRRMLIAAGVLLALRLLSLAANNTELFFDEAQYWAWSREWAFGYFSKPPLIAWIIGAVTAAFGNSEFAVRLAAPVLHAATSLVVGLIGRELADARTGFWASVVYATLPAVTLSSTLISTDVPLLLFWATALLALIRMERGRNATLMLGLSLGLGLLSKYAMAYFFLCAAIHGWSSRGRPTILANRGFWLASAIGIGMLAPNLLWNAANDFVTVGHTGDNIGWDGGVHFKALGDFLGSQFGVFGPILFAMFLVAAVRLMREGMNEAQRLLLNFSLPVVAIVTVQALLSKAYANWAAVAYIAATVLVVDIMVNRIPLWWHRLSLAIHLAAVAVVSVAVAFGRPGQIPFPDGVVSPFARMQGARQVADAARQLLQQGGQRAVIVDNRRAAALMHYYLRDAAAPVRSWRESAPADHFELKYAWQDSRQTPALYLTGSVNPARVIRNFARAELAGEVAPAGNALPKSWFYSLADPK
jgi:4-amino-4-deoxy-L-arabinose transferase-like glycosyltransferase